MHQFLLALHDKHGPVASFWYGTEYCISIGNADLMKQVKHLFDRPAKLFEMVEPMIGKSSIQFANGEDGKRRHKLLVDAMSIKTSERLMPGLIQVKTSINNLILYQKILKIKFQTITFPMTH